MHALAIEPYYGGSHRVFLDGISRHSTHRWSQLTLPARHWKWRMRSAPPILARMFLAQFEAQEFPDVVLASDMLDIATWVGWVARDRRARDWIAAVPIVMYFHENQWAYPDAPQARPDHHYAFTNLLSASLADECWFNSHHNRTTFLQHSREFLSRMPDDRNVIDVDAFGDGSLVIPPGFTPPQPSTRRDDATAPLRIGWVGRFEHDKRPDRFEQLLLRLSSRRIDFQLVLLGGRGRRVEGLDRILERYRGRILHDGFADQRSQYEHWLSQIDVVVSTADHEFFGIAMCEAIWAGAVPVVPNQLSYVEFVPRELRFDDLEQAARLIERLRLPQQRQAHRKHCRDAIAGFRIDQVTQQVDRELQRVVDHRRGTTRVRSD